MSAQQTPTTAADGGPTGLDTDLRDWFAGLALTGIVTAMLGKKEAPEAAFAFGAYQIADAMLAERAKVQP